MAGSKNRKVKKVLVVDRNRCEGKGPCIEVCPTNVLSMKVLSKEERKYLSSLGKVKGFMHGWKQVSIDFPDRCIACGKCVSACPEKALSLELPKR
jgi:4Fe-4S ferredoxin